MMKVAIEIDEDKIRELVLDFLNEQLGELGAEMRDIKIETKSWKPYAVWEEASFRATVGLVK